MELWQSLRFGTRALALQRAARKSPGEIERVQQRRLRRLLRHARSHSAFYRERLGRVDDARIELADLPVTTKSEMMEDFDRVPTTDDLRREEIESFLEDPANRGRYYLKEYVLSHTSGSQGQPLLIVQSKDDFELLFALQASRGNHQSLGLRQLIRHFRSPARLAAVTLEPGFYPSACAFEFMPPGAHAYIETLRLSVSDDALIDRLAGFRPTHLTAYASVLHDLARAVESGRLSLRPHLQQVVNISERLIPQARKHYAELFGAAILDDYAMGECLFLSNGCPTSPGMHVNADWAILEVVDELNRPVPNGVKGDKVLLTNLANFIQPFIRYEIGDIVTMAKRSCNCGSNLPLIARVEGRDSDQFWVESEEGLRAVSPAILELALSHLTETREYQFVQEDEGFIRVRIEPLPGIAFDRAQAEQALAAQLAEYGLEQKLRIEIELVDRLVPEDGAKFKRVLCKVSQPAAG